jgi:hypothetical protein
MTSFHRHTSRGAAIAEFLIAVVGVLLPLLLSAWQLALLGVSKDLVNLAALMAARAGAVEHGSLAVMRAEVARSLVPLYGNTAALAEAEAVAPVVAAYARARADTALPHVLQVEILNPTAESFADFEREQSGGRGIPNQHLEHYGDRRGARSGQSLLDANTLSIRITYCQRLIVPLVAQFVPAVLATAERDPRSLACYRDQRVPIVAHAIVMMHSDPRRGAMGL